MRTITGRLQRLGTPEFRILVSWGPGSLDALAKLLGGRRVEVECKRGRQS